MPKRVSVPTVPALLPQRRRRGGEHHAGHAGAAGSTHGALRAADVLTWISAVGVRAEGVHPGHVEGERAEPVRRPSRPRPGRRRGPRARRGPSAPPLGHVRARERDDTSSPRSSSRPASAPPHRPLPPVRKTRASRGPAQERGGRAREVIGTTTPSWWRRRPPSPSSYVHAADRIAGVARAMAMNWMLQVLSLPTSTAPSPPPSAAIGPQRHQDDLAAEGVTRTARRRGPAKQGRDSSRSRRRRRTGASARPKHRAPTTPATSQSWSEDDTSSRQAEPSGREALHPGSETRSTQAGAQQQSGAPVSL